MSSRLSILIVDDEFGLAEMLRELLSEYGHQVALAMNGRRALEILNERQIDLVVTDMMMPVMDGAELAAAMRASDAHGRVPILLMTSLPTVFPRESGLYDAVIRKPFTPEMLLAAMAECVGARLKI